MRVCGLFEDRTRAPTRHGSWTWTVRGHGQTAVVVADWLRTRTDRGRGCGLDKASRPDNGTDISPLNRGSFADIRALITQGVRRPTLNPHKSCGHLRSILCSSRATDQSCSAFAIAMFFVIAAMESTH